MNNKQKAEQKIRDLVPELQKLEFGCEFNWNVPTVNGFGGRYTITQIDEDINFKGQMTIMAIQNTPLRDIEDVCKFDERILKEDVFEIIGKPIELGAITETLKKQNLPKEDYEKLVLKVVGLWDYNKEYGDQKEELYDLLWETYSV